MNSQKWKFFEYRKGEKRRNSSSGKHFTGLDVNESLIRELIQNSLDAVDDKNTIVKVLIQFKELEAAKCIRYFENLKQHYKASYNKDMILDQKIKFLILEDFNTTGLNGDKKDDFFLKDNIRSGSDNSSGGSHGIGKIVFYEASQIKTFFAYSVYENGDVFQGTCDFETHSIDEKEYREDGTLELCPNNDKLFIQELFKRTGKQRGLSIAIPLPQEVETEKLKNAIIQEYYYPIIGDKLTIELVTLEREKTKIDGNYILDSRGAKNKLASDYSTSPRPDILIEIGTKYKSGQSNKKLITSDEEEHITSKLKNDKIVSIRFYFSIIQKRSSTVKGYLDFLIVKNIDNKDEKFDFWRENILIKEASSRKNRSSQYIIIVLVNGEDNELSSLLRELENPSHTRWDYQKLPDEIKSKYQHIPKLVPFITQLPSKIIHQITTSNIDLDSNFFSDLFPDISAVGEKSDQGQNSQNTKPENPDRNISSNPNFIFRENRKNNGFIISLSEKGKQKGILRINIKIAYGTNKGNPFRNYDVKDFDLEKNIDVKLTSGKQISKQENQLSCQVNNSDFKVSISGFDPDRELKIDVGEE